MELQIKYKLKYYKFINNADTVSISVGINSSHGVSDEILGDLRRSINKVFEAQYIDESVYKIKKECMKNEEEYQKKQEKKMKEFMKQNKK